MDLVDYLFRDKEKEFLENRLGGYLRIRTLTVQESYQVALPDEGYH